MRVKAEHRTHVVDQFNRSLTATYTGSIKKSTHTHCFLLHASPHSGRVLRQLIRCWWPSALQEATLFYFPASTHPQEQQFYGIHSLDWHNRTPYLKQLLSDMSVVCYEHQLLQRSAKQLCVCVCVCCTSGISSQMSQSFHQWNSHYDAITDRPTCLFLAMLSVCTQFIVTRNYTAVLSGSKLIDLFLREVFLFSLCVHSCWLSTRSSKHPPWSWLQEWLLIIQQQGSTLWKGKLLAISWKFYFLKMLLSAFLMADLLEIWYWLKAGGCWKYESNEAWSDAVFHVAYRERSETKWNLIMTTGERTNFDEYTWENVLGTT